MLDLSTLNPAQREAVCAPDGPILVIAGAGSGKTRTIVHRLAWLCEQGVSPHHMLLLTFTRKASREMLDRAALLLGQSLHGVHGGTFHGFAYAVLRHHRPSWAKHAVTIMDGHDSVVAVQQCKEALKLGKGDRSFPRSQAVLGLCSKARNKELSLDEVLRRESPHLMVHADALNAIGEAYAAYRRTHNLLDYDDLLFELEALLVERPELAASLHERHRYLMVDEYQDTNRVQARLTRLLAGERANVMAVGDDAQSIYAFRGADVRNILDFKLAFPAARFIRLEENYRSTQGILNVANGVLAPSPQAFAKNLFTSRQGGILPRLIRPISDKRQAELICTRIEDLLHTYKSREIAVLFRAGYHSYQLEVALSKRGIRFRKYGGLRYAEAAHIKDVLAFARLVINPLDRLSLLRIADMHKGVGPKTAHTIFELVRDNNHEGLQKKCAKYPGLLADLTLLDSLRREKRLPAELFALVASHYQPHLEHNYPEDWPRRLQGLEELAHIASSYTDLEQFIADLSLESPEEEEEREDAIVLSTIHSAKGLEWDAVMLIDLVEDRFPSRHALARPEDYEEERRLMYVAVTRAREVLEMYVPLTVYNKVGATSERTTDSPFVRELSPTLYEEWHEGYSGALTLREMQPQRYAAPPLSYSMSRPDARPAPLQGGSAAFIQDGSAMPTPGGSPPTPLSCGFCHHKVFGRGKIVEHLPPDKCRVNFPGFGLKVILSAYLVMEEA